MSKIRNFFLDIDGTMLIRGKKQLTDDLITALRYAQAKGCKIFVNTGRTKSFLPYSIAKLDCFDGFLCGCGTYIEHAGKVLSEYYVEKDELIRLTDLFLSIMPNSNLVYEGKERMYYVGVPEPWFENEGLIPVGTSDYFKNVGFDVKIHKFSTHGKDADQRKDTFFDAISDRFQTLRFPHYCESIPHGYDKGRAIELTEKALGLDPSLSIAVGDSMNDAAMLKYAATSVAMGDATDEVKALCDLVIGTAENEGLTKFIYETV